MHIQLLVKMANQNTKILQPIMIFAAFVDSNLCFFLFISICPSLFLYTFSSSFFSFLSLTNEEHAWLYPKSEKRNFSLSSLPTTALHSSPKKKESPYFQLSEPYTAGYVFRSLYRISFQFSVILPSRNLPFRVPLYEQQSESCIHQEHFFP
jgi:hypothetical protein